MISPLIVSSIAFFVIFAITLPIMITRGGVKLRWFGYWLIHGRPHPDHIAKCLADSRKKP